MIDYIYSRVKGLKAANLFANQLLDFHTTLNLKTGELTTNVHRKKNHFKPRDEKIAVFKNCEFKIINDTHINFEGSLHEYFNNGSNHSAFTVVQLFKTISELYEKFKINPHTATLHNVEFGININLPIPTKDFLDAIISLRGKEGNRYDFNGKGDMVKFVFGQYELKIYDKAKQKNLPGNILRFELKVKKMEFLQKKGIPIHTIADLLNPDVHTRLLKLLLRYCNQLIFYDKAIDLSLIKANEVSILKDGQNPRYWTDLKKDNSENFKKKIVRYNGLISKHGKTKFSAVLSIHLKNKWQYLTRIDQPKLIQLQQFLAKTFSESFPDLTTHKTNSGKKPKK